MASGTGPGRTSRFRRLVVTKKVVESAGIASFHLAGDDGEPLWPARAGQYLTLRVPAHDAGSEDAPSKGHVLRTYSISGDAADAASVRITVRREGAPRVPSGTSDVPHGAGSGWLHDRIEVGSTFEVAAPRGTFTLDDTSDRPVVLLSGGVGQTPLLSMLHALARSDRRVWFVHACENGEVHAMADEVAALTVPTGGRMQHRFVYRNPTDADASATRFHTAGIVDRALLQSLLPLDDYDWYLCGPVPFMVAVYRTLLSLGVPDGRIAHEFFGRSKSLAILAAEAIEDERILRTAPAAARPGAGSKAPAALAKLAFLTDPDARAASDDGGRARPERRESISPRTPPGPVAGLVDPGRGSASDRGASATNALEVVFARSGVTVPWSAASGSLLELAEAAGLALDFSCRSGICSTCLCTVLDGEVEYPEAPLAEPAPGTALLCCSRPKGRLTLDI